LCCRDIILEVSRAVEREDDPVSMSDDEEFQLSMEGRILSEFSAAYPDIEREKLVHMSRNFTQVMRGIIDIGERIGDDGEVSQMDVANGLVYSCMVNTRLEDMVGVPSGDGRSSVSAEDFEALVEECVARVSDWLIALEIMRQEGPEVYRRFIKGAVALGAADWKRDRGGLRY